MIKKKTGKTLNINCRLTINAIDQILSNANHRLTKGSIVRESLRNRRNAALKGGLWQHTHVQDQYGLNFYACWILNLSCTFYVLLQLISSGQGDKYISSDEFGTSGLHFTYHHSRKEIKSFFVILLNSYCVYILLLT